MMRWKDEEQNFIGNINWDQEAQSRSGWKHQGRPTFNSEKKMTGNDIEDDNL